MKGLTLEQKIALLQTEKSVLEQKVHILESELRKLRAQEYLLNKNLSEISPKDSVVSNTSATYVTPDFDFCYKHFYEIQNLFFEELSYLDLQSELSKLLQRELLYFQDSCQIRPEFLISNFNQLWNKILNLSS